MMIFLIGLCTIVMFIVAPFIQIRLYEIEPEYFKKIKIRKLTFLFKGIGGKNSIYGSVKEYGIIIPMFAIQIMGYILAILSWIFVPILYFALRVDLTTIAIIIASILGVELFILVLTTFICIIISNKNRKSK